MTVGLRPFTSADLESLPDFPGVRYEIIDGEMYVSRAPQVAHQVPCSRIGSSLDAWNDETGAGFVVHGPGLVFSEDNDVIPDLVWVSRARLREALDEKGHFRLAPEIVVEVLSPGRANEVRDREIKLGLYARRGVQEYWLVDWQTHAVEIYRRSGEELLLAATLGDTDEIESPLLPGFRCSVARLWLPDDL